MFDAQTLLVAASTIEVFSPWFPRGGDTVRCVAEALSIAGGSAPELTVEVLTKKSDETGDGTAASGTPISLTAVGRSTIREFTGLEDMIRFRFTFESDNVAWVIFRMLPPCWFDAATS